MGVGTFGGSDVPEVFRGVGGGGGVEETRSCHTGGSRPAECHYTMAGAKKTGWTDLAMRGV